ncbi:MAG TPA: hypothetical protein VFX70_06905 [Mycobacteriales bacterium]|nr:hypothetical protein [Mycobacteriales bacterium]
MPGYGRDDQTWDRLVDAGLRFLVERAKLRKTTSYTEFNTVVSQRTSTAGFDFERADERAAVGHLLGLIVDQNYPTTALMISALVSHLGANDAGPGFYALATERRLLPPRASAEAKMEFWVRQVNGLFEYYAGTGGTLPSPAAGVPGLGGS